MHALSLARQRLRAKIHQPSTPRPVRLAHDLVENGQGRLLPALSSSVAQDILAGGYDALALQRVYANRTRGGLVGRIADRVVLDLPVHQGLRERLQAAVGETYAAAVLAHRSGEREFRVLFAPCGLGAEMLGVADRLRAERPEVFASFRAWGVDLDPDNQVLSSVAGSARVISLQATLIREDLRRQREVAAAAKRVGGFHLVSCIGLGQLFSPADVKRLILFYASLLTSGGTLLIDRWLPGGAGEPGEEFAEAIRRLPAADLHEALKAAGLAVEREHPTGEGGCILTIARKA